MQVADVATLGDQRRSRRHLGQQGLLGQAAQRRLAALHAGFGKSARCGRLEPEAHWPVAVRQAAALARKLALSPVQLGLAVERGEQRVEFTHALGRAQ